jgi:acyl-CoA reductase-like NAD-dependent aldehyde dehydrogenase
MATVAARELHVVNPATLEVVATVPATDPAAVQELVSEAAIAQERWRATTHEERRELLVAVAELLLDRTEEVVAAVLAETGKPEVEAYTSELFPALDTLVWLAANAASILAPERVRPQKLLLRHKRGWLLYEPRGVVAVISPWNFPFGIPLTQTAAAVAAGNAVVLKPSELTPLSAVCVERAFADAGAPAGLVRVAQGDGTVGDTLVRARGLGKVVFTGSPEVGRSVAASAGACLVPVTLELGGKDPMLVLEDADLERAVAGALWGSFLNAGQVCSGVERIYVHERLYAAFVDELARRAAELRLGVDVGPLVSSEQRDRVAELIDDAVARGASVRVGGRPREGRGWFFEPTVLTDVPANARIEAEEIFGPVVTVAPGRDERELVRAANDSAYGLGASVWTRDAEAASRVGRQLAVGSVWHNDHAYSYGAAQASWGGRKVSGFGLTHSKHGLYELSAVKFVDRDDGRVRVPWWFPYDRTLADGFAGALGLLYRRGVRGKAAAAWRHRRGLVTVARRYVR